MTTKQADQYSSLSSLALHAQLPDNESMEVVLLYSNQKVYSSVKCVLNAREGLVGIVCMCMCGHLLHRPTESDYLHNETLGVHHPDLFQTKLLRKSFLLHRHGDEVSDSHGCLGEEYK